MKRFFISTIILALMSLTAVAQVTSQNYINTTTVLNSGQTSYVNSIEYFDGIGRSLQTVEAATANNTAAGTNTATLQEYDNAGRLSNQWLPIHITGTYLAPAAFKTRATGSNGRADAKPYSHTEYEASPLNRIAQQYGAGSQWHTKNRSIKTEYLSNVTDATSPLSCKLYTVSGDALTGGTSYYPAGLLKVTRTYDEDNNVSYIFTDKLERTILQRTVTTGGFLDTYFVYDNLGNQRFVLQPRYQDAPDVNLHAFQYKYNRYNLCCWKKLPGSEYIVYKYNDKGLLVESQDGNQRAAGTSTKYTYDDFNRLVSKDGVVNYYDNYTFMEDNPSLWANYTAGNATYSKGKLTGKVVSVIGNGSTAKIYTVYCYDSCGRVSKTMQNNLLGGYDITKTSYTYTNKPDTVIRTHSANGETARTETTSYTYDEKDRLKTITHKLDNNTAVTLVSYTYDAYGRVIEKKLHNSHPVTYAYNIRNWVTNINATKFQQNLYYNTGNGTSYYNGNISSTTWKSGDETTTRGYKFAYDSANRMTKGTYGEGAAISSNADRFSESATYDKNGNIISLQRKGQTSSSSYTLLDSLKYTYNGNQVTKIEDDISASSQNGNTSFTNGASAANEYTYDANGNMTKDLNKDISNIKYNLLNLPEEVTFTNGNSTKFFYSAEGEKLRVVHTTGSTTTQNDYCGNIVYEAGVQKYLLNQEGYYDLEQGDYHYYLKDHLGNNRVVINQSGTVQQTNHYYPYGGTFASTSTGSNTQPYKYNGKEYDTHNGLNWYDYGARHYDPAIARWMTQDPLAEKYYAMTPYGYCAGNPVIFVDENGEWVANVVGGVLGGVVEYAGQVAVNRISGKSWSESFTKIDIADIGAAVAEGAITAGTSVVRKAMTKTAISIASDVIKNAVDIDISKDGIDASVASFDDFVLDSTIDAITGGVKVDAKVKVWEPGSVNKQKKIARAKEDANKDVFNPKAEEAKAKEIIKAANDINSTVTEYTSSSLGVIINNSLEGGYERIKN